MLTFAKLSDEGELTTDDGGVAGSALVVTRRPISRAINCTASVLRRDETQGTVLVLLELSACCKLGWRRAAHRWSAGGACHGAPHAARVLGCPCLFRDL